MFMYNMYLQIRNLSDKNANRPNMLLLVSATLLFVMITCVSCHFFRRHCAQDRSLIPSQPPSVGLSGWLGSTRPSWILRVGFL